MKKKLIIAFSLSCFFMPVYPKMKVKDFFKIVKSIDSYILDQANNFLNTISGFNIQNIISGINATKTNIETAKNDSTTIPTQLQAPTGPIPLGKKIANNIGIFKSAISITQKIKPPQLFAALFDPTALNNLSATLTSDLKNILNNLKKAQDTIFSSINSLQVSPVLGTVQGMLTNFNKVVTSIVKIRDNTGFIGKKFISDDLKTALVNIGKDMVNIATSVGNVVKGGLPNIPKLGQDLINGLIFNLSNLDKLIANITATVTYIIGQVTAIIPVTSNIKNAATGLVNTGKNIVTNIKTRLKNEIQSLAVKVTLAPVIGTKKKPGRLSVLKAFTPAKWAGEELGKSIKTLMSYLHAILDGAKIIMANAAAMFASVFQSISIANNPSTGLPVINSATGQPKQLTGVFASFKEYLGVNLLPSQTLQGLNGISTALTKLVTDLGSVVTALFGTLA